jgi:hypothetical protein
MMTAQATLHKNRVLVPEQNPKQFLIFLWNLSRWLNILTEQTLNRTGEATSGEFSGDSPASIGFAPLRMPSDRNRGLASGAFPQASRPT